MTMEKLNADLTTAIAGARDAGMTPKEIANCLRNILYTVDITAKWDKPTSTPTRSGPSRVAQCL